jgi:superfamily I DNA and/or RNA helicase
MIINKARIVNMALSISGFDNVEVLKGSFDYLIIDEACQRTEVFTLKLFAFGARKMILVG